MKYAPFRCLSYASLSLLICLLSSCKQDCSVSEPAAASAVDTVLAPTVSQPAESHAATLAYYVVELTDCGRSEAQVISELLKLNPDMLHNNAKKALRHLPYVLAEKVIESDARALKSSFETVGATILIKQL